MSFLWKLGDRERLISATARSQSEADVFLRVETKADSDSDKTQGDDAKCKHVESQNWASIFFHCAEQTMSTDL